jgi:hypothetical protein
MDQRQTPGGAKRDRQKMMEAVARNAVFARERMRREKQGESRDRNLRDLIPGMNFDSTEESRKISRERRGAAKRESALRKRGRGN